MTMRLIESFEHCTTAQMFTGGKWTATSAPGEDFVANGVGRFGDRGAAWVATGRRFWKTFSTSESEWTVGVALKLGVNADGYPINFFDSSAGSIASGNAGWQCGLQVSPSGAFVAKRGVNGTAGTSLGSTSAGLFTVGIWHYIEVSATIHNSTGAFIVHYDGVEVLNLSGVDTTQTANNNADSVVFGMDGGGFAFQGGVWYDDIYILDGNGATNNTFLGEVHVECRYPNGNGAHSDFVGSDANSTDNYLLVDEAQPNENTDYVQSGSVSAMDTYEYQDLVATVGNVYGVQAIPRARKTDVGAREIAVVSRDSGGTEDVSASHVLTTDYQYFPEIYEEDPDGNPWTISSFNSNQFGETVAA